MHLLQSDVDLSVIALWLGASDDYRRAIAARGMVASMSRAGDCWDNAVAESFFATLRAELVDDEHYATRSIAAASIGESPAHCGSWMT